MSADKQRRRHGGGPGPRVVRVHNNGVEPLGQAFQALLCVAEKPLHAEHEDGHAKLADEEVVDHAELALTYKTQYGTTHSLDLQIDKHDAIKQQLFIATHTHTDT